MTLKPGTNSSKKIPRHEFLGGSRGKKRRGGAPLMLSPANFTADPSMFGSPYAKVKGVGCAGTACNVKAAEGKYVSYDQMGGSSVVCQAENPIIKDHVIGPKAGHSSVTACPSGLVRSDLSAPLLEPLSLKGGKRRKRKATRKRKTHRKKKAARRTRKGRKGKKRRSRRGGKKGFRRGTPSKTHPGKKDFSTRKTSKRYRRDDLDKYLRGRKTVMAPDFPFVGGSASNPCSNVPLAFGYSTGGPGVDANTSALASPPPQHVYDHCMKNNFPPRA